MSPINSQKFIGKNRAPRVQIEYDVELNGTEKKVNLPFVMGVLSDLSGKSEIPPLPVEERRVLEINAENFDDRLKSVAPRVAFNVPNTLSGEGNISVDMTFESMDDFSPGKVVSKVDGLKQLMEARQQLSNLLSYMDGKSGAEELLNKILSDPALLKALASKAKEAPAEGAADAAPSPEGETK
jgi:type VI secretion system protein ImpB